MNKDLETRRSKKCNIYYCKFFVHWDPQWMLKFQILFCGLHLQTYRRRYRTCWHNDLHMSHADLKCCMIFLSARNVLDSVCRITDAIIFWFIYMMYMYFKWRTYFYFKSWSTYNTTLSESKANYFTRAINGLLKFPIRATIWRNQMPELTDNFQET